MNAEIGVQWRNYGSGNQSPSIVLPPLPDLIPIRKNGTPIKNVFHLEDKIINSCSNSTSNSQCHAEHHEQIDVDLNILSSTISMLEREEDLEWPPSQKPLPPPVNSSSHDKSLDNFSKTKYFNFNIKKERDDDIYRIERNIPTTQPLTNNSQIDDDVQSQQQNNNKFIKEEEVTSQKENYLSLDEEEKEEEHEEEEAEADTERVSNNRKSGRRKSRERKHKRRKNSLEKCFVNNISDKEVLKEEEPVTRINPIFLWVKQDNTQIVEVRCEDYDKRNRIRLTKTANGWRAIPRTESNSTNELTEGRKHEHRKKSHKRKHKKKKRHSSPTNHQLPLSSPTAEKNTSSHDNEITDNWQKIESETWPEPLEPLNEIIQNITTSHAISSGDEDTAHVINEELLSATELELNNHQDITNKIECTDKKSTLLHFQSTLQNDDLDCMEITNETNDENLTFPNSVVYETNQCLSDINQTIENVEHIEDVDSDDEHESKVLEREEFHGTTDLIESIRNIESGNEEDLMEHCDNTINGAELLDSLVEQGCEENNIMSIDDDDDDLMMDAAPVADIISRLGESLSQHESLSFNDEIDGMSDDLFDFNHHHHIHNHHHQEMDHIPMTINLDDKIIETPKEPKPVSPDSCEDDLPKDLSYKTSSRDLSLKPIQSSDILSSCRPTSRGSDTIQSPQPSGLPAVPPSPDIIFSSSQKSICNKPEFLESLLNSSNSISFTKVPSTQQQKQPLDLGTSYRKSASPTVTCSEEANTLSSVDVPQPKRIKLEDTTNNKKQQFSSRNPEKLNSAKDPDPLTQLRLLISNPEWKVPDPLLVPKDRLNAVLASPAREIPLLLTTRPELRLPEAFAFPGILQDPNIVVITLAKLESILQKQDEALRTIPKPNNDKSSPESDKRSSTSRDPAFVGGLANEIDAATTAVFNQMFWLPYMRQMGQMNTNILKAMSEMSQPDLLPLLAQAQAQGQNGFPNFQQFQNPMGFHNPLELVMWQEAMAAQNSPAFQNLMKMNESKNQQKLKDDRKTSKQNYTFHQQQQQQQMKQQLLQQQQHQQQLQQMQNQKKQIESQYQPQSGAMINPYSAINSVPFMQQMQQQGVPNPQFFGSVPRPPLRSPTTPEADFLSNFNRNQQQMANNQNQRDILRKNQNTSSMVKNPFGYFGPGGVPNVNGQNYNDIKNNMKRLQKDQLEAIKNQQEHEKASRGVTCKSLVNLLEPSYLETQEAAKSNLMSPEIQQNRQMLDRQNSQGKLKIKPRFQLLDPAAAQRKLLNDDVPEVVSSTGSLDDSPEGNLSLWHPLFGR